jgi:quinol monooxygenase YgiN
MSVLVIIKLNGDTATLRQTLGERTAELQKIVDTARAQGCLRHQFGIAEGFALVVDEWESVEQFQGFFADPELQAFMAGGGVDPEPPEIIVAEALDVTKY